MTIYLSICKDKNNKIGKTQIGSVTFEGTLKGETSIVSPTILIEGSDLTQFNYASIPAFHRKYFINDIKSMRTNLWEISLKCDVLESFKNEILALPAVVEKSQTQKIYDKFIDDGSYITDARPIYDIYDPIDAVHSLETSSSFILITAGDPDNQNNIYNIPS